MVAAITCYGAEHGDKYGAREVTVFAGRWGRVY